MPLGFSKRKLKDVAVINAHMPQDVNSKRSRKHVHHKQTMKAGSPNFEQSSIDVAVSALTRKGFVPSPSCWQTADEPPSHATIVQLPDVPQWACTLLS